MPSDQLTLFAAASPASPLVLPGSDKARKMTATSGLKCIGSWTSSGPLGLLAKMFLASSIWGSTKCFLTWKPVATPGKRLLFRLSPSMPHIDESDFGLWQTPVSAAAVARVKGKFNSRGEPKLSAQVKMWPTPQAHDTAPGKASRVGRFGTKHGGRDLNDWAAMWPTPHGFSQDGKSNGPSGNELGRAVNQGMYPTPDVGMAKGRGEASAEKRHRVGGSLNPNFVEDLMGFPKGLTEL